MQNDPNENTGTRTMIGLWKWLVAFIIAIHCFLVVWMSFWNSPSFNEPCHLAAGVYTLRFGRTDLYRVNPPLARMVAAIPATYFFDIDANWLSTATNVLSYRPEYEVGASLFSKNDPDKLFYAIAFGRLMLLPFSLLGAWACYRFSLEIYGKVAAFFALLLWCFNPYVLTWAATVNPDIVATSVGIFSFYLFWHWCRLSSWKNTLWVGGALGGLFVTRTVWVIVFGLLPILWLIAFFTGGKKTVRHFSLQASQLFLAFVIAFVVLNMFYNFSGSFRPLKEYSFISASLAGQSQEQQRMVKNRFAESWLGNIPVPFPQDYVYGIDVQKFDFERGIPSYINGSWSERGFWYYYIYAFLLKTPIGFQLLMLLALFLSLVNRQFRSTWLNEAILILPFCVILGLISSQDGFSVHSRYLLPLLPFLVVWSSKVGLCFEPQDMAKVRTNLSVVLCRVTVLILVAWGMTSSLSVFPHSMSYFNEFAGGPANGGRYLLGSDLDWGQDVYHLQQWQKRNPDARPLRISLSWTMPLENTAIRYDGIVPREGDGTNIFAAIKPGWYAINVNNVFSRNNEYAYFRNETPVAKAGWSINIYHFDENEIDERRREYGLPTIGEERKSMSDFYETLLHKKSCSQGSAKAALYSGKGVTEGSLTAIKELLSAEDHVGHELDMQSIRSGQLSDFDLIIVPGGISNEMADALGNEGREAIRQFVRSGGGYIGICAGAYLASATFEKFLGLVNVKTNHYQEYMPRVGMQEHRQLGSALVNVTFSHEGQKLFSQEEYGTIDYINGPIFIEAGRLDLPPFLTLATYQSDIYQYHFQQGTMPNTPAIVAGQFGNGYVILFSSHPELTKGMESLVVDAVRMVRRVCPQNVTPTGRR